MDRRGFLGALLSTAVLDPERLLWVPGRKLISIPSPRWFSNDAAEAPLSLENLELALAQMDAWARGEKITVKGRVLAYAPESRQWRVYYWTAVP